METLQTAVVFVWRARAAGDRGSLAEFLALGMPAGRTDGRGPAQRGHPLLRQLRLRRAQVQHPPPPLVDDLELAGPDGSTEDTEPRSMKKASRGWASQPCCCHGQKRRVLDSGRQTCISGFQRISRPSFLISRSSTPSIPATWPATAGRGAAAAGAPPSAEDPLLKDEPSQPDEPSESEDHESSPSEAARGSARPSPASTPRKSPPAQAVLAPQWPPATVRLVSIAMANAPGCVGREGY